MLKLRDYQKECINKINGINKGSYLVQMATGLGKTATFTNIPRKGRVLILAHREELVEQPVKYYDCSVGIEMAGSKSNNEEVVIASVQSLYKRLDKFNSNDFDMIITDEAHHAAAKTYKGIFNYFKPRLHLGFTATPNRGDKVRLDDIYKDIIFSRDIKWAIENKYLSNIYCIRTDIGYNLSAVRNRLGDLDSKQLEENLNIEKLNKAVAEVYYKYAKGQTVIFATSVKHAKAIAKEIKDSVVVTSNTVNRGLILNKFKAKEIKVLINCMILTEGTDLPMIETIIIARPTQNESLYIQMVGRGLRLYPNKDKLILIDCVGVTGEHNICTAPSLLGLDLDNVPRDKLSIIEGNILDLPAIIDVECDTPESWIRNIEIVNMWAKKQKYNTHNMNLFKMPNGDLVVAIEKEKLKISAQDELGNVKIEDKFMPMQQALDILYKRLCIDYSDYRSLWDLTRCKKWGKEPATEKQKYIIQQKIKDYNVRNLTKLEASLILNRLL